MANDTSSALAVREADTNDIGGLMKLDTACFAEIPMTMAYFVEGQNSVPIFLTYGADCLMLIFLHINISERAGIE